MIKKRIMFIVICVLILSSNSAVYGYGMAGQPVPWLDWGVGARTIALGRTQTAINSQGAAIILNPADLAWQQANYLTLMHTPTEEKINYDYGGISYQLTELAAGFGLGYQRLAVEGIEEYGHDDNFIGYFNNVEQALTLGFGQMFSPNFALGGAVKLISQNIHTERGLGYSLGVGLKWQPVANLTIGTVAHNLTGQVKWTTGFVEKPPLRLRGGVAYYWPGWDLLVTGDYIDDEGDLPLHLGIEKGYQQNLRFRAGLDGLTPTFGIGLIMARLEVDYALLLDVNLGKKQYLSLNWRY